MRTRPQKTSLSFFPDTSSLVNTLASRTETNTTIDRLILTRLDLSKGALEGVLLTGGAEGRRNTIRFAHLRFVNLVDSSS